MVAAPIGFTGDGCNKHIEAAESLQYGIHMYRVELVSYGGRDGCCRGLSVYGQVEPEARELSSCLPELLCTLIVFPYLRALYFWRPR